MRGATAALAALPAAAASAPARGGNTSLTSFAGTLATGAAPQCPDGSPARWAIVWSDLYNQRPGLDLSGMAGVVPQGGGSAYGTGVGPDPPVPGSPTRPSWVGRQGYGIFPFTVGPWCDTTIDPNCTRQPLIHNGGIPQRANLTAHVAQLTKAINDTLPPDFAGYMGFDYEGWAPVWDDQLSKSASVELVRESHPDWPEDRVLAQAEADFTAAARAFWLATLRTARGLRPRTRWGFYSTPFRISPGDWWEPGRESRLAEMRAHNDNMTWLWEEVDMFMPTLYLHSPNGTRLGPGAEGNAEFVRGNVREAERLIAMVAPARAKRGLPEHEIVPWVWERYGGAAWLNDADVRSEFVVPFEFPHTTALLKWGDPVIGKVQIPQLQAYVDAVLKPLANATMEAACACAKSRCQSHGRCYPKPQPATPAPPLAPTPPPPPGPHPAPPPPGPGACVALLKQLAGPAAEVPGCRQPTEEKCVTCLKPHADAMRRAGCTNATEAGYCHGFGPAAAGTEGDGELCRCDDGWGGADCGTERAPRERGAPAAAGAAAPRGGGGVTCSDGVSACAAGHTCAQYVNGMFGCCPLPDATVCDYNFGPYCCPSGYTCGGYDYYGAGGVCYRA